VTAKRPARRKLGYKEQQELETLPKRIEELEAEQQTLEALTAEKDLVLSRTFPLLDAATSDEDQGGNGEEAAPVGELPTPVETPASELPPPAGGLDALLGGGETPPPESE